MSDSKKTLPNQSSTTSSSNSVSNNSKKSQNWVQQRFPKLYAFWKFSRPHTIIGTTLSVFSLWAIALGEHRIDLAAIPTASLIFWPLGTLITCLCGNVYIVGLNQLEDIPIDRINKPHLPLASGEFSRSQGRWIVAVTGVMALLLAAIQGYGLMATVWISLLIGTAYSVPPIRLKRFPIWASFCIFTVRGVVVNLGLFLHFRQLLTTGQGWSWLPANGGLIPLSVWVLTGFVIVFTLAIALCKDIPDIEGDRRYHITTFTVKLGARAVFNLTRGLLTVCYVGMSIAGLAIASLQTHLVVITHLALLGLFWFRSTQVNLHSQLSIARFYQFIWKLFFLEYLLFPVCVAIN